MEWGVAGSIRSSGGPPGSIAADWGGGRCPSRPGPHPDGLVEGSRLGPCPSYTWPLGDPFGSWRGPRLREREIQ